MTYGELPSTGLYIILSVVVVWTAILTTQIADVRKREHEHWKEDAWRLARFTTWLLRIARVGAGQVAIVLLFAAWHAYEPRLEGQSTLEAWWNPVHILVHFVVVVSLLLFLVRWFRAMERAPKTPY